MHPFLALMRRYCIDYSGVHDLAVIDEVMVPGYMVRTCGLDLPRDPVYKETVAQIFTLFPGLDFVVHDIVTNGDRLAMRFSEHGMTAEGSRLSCWRGVATYKWDGTRLTECFVEQDFFGRRRQLKSGVPDALEPPHLDPWMATVPVPPDPEAEATVVAWLTAGDLAAVASGWVDDAPASEHRHPLETVDVEIDDLFSAGDRVAFHATARGEHRSGVGADDLAGRPASLGIAGIATVAAGGVADIRVVTDRLGLRARLLDAPLLPTG